MPRRISGNPSFAFCAATRKIAGERDLEAAAEREPVDRGDRDLRDRLEVAAGLLERADVRPRSRPARSSTIALMSAPAAKIRSPPQTTTARTASSPVTLAAASESSTETARASAFAGGRSMRIVATPPSVSMRTNSPMDGLSSQTAARETAPRASVAPATHCYNRPRERDSGPALERRRDLGPARARAADDPAAAGDRRRDHAHAGPHLPDGARPQGPGRHAGRERLDDLPDAGAARGDGGARPRAPGERRRVPPDRRGRSRPPDLLELRRRGRPVDRRGRRARSG